MTMNLSDYNLDADLTQPADDAAAVTPSDVATLPIKPARALHIGGAGNVKVVTARGSTVTFVGLTAGQLLPVRVTQVFATDTTATSIVALY